ncbi:MAG: alpha/beta fold hydrolase [Polyangiaceae bacterium]
MREKAIQFGEQKGLVGIVSLPPEHPSERQPAILFLNAGLVHRVGPFRMNVELARRIADRGFVSLRMDQSGLGDSAPRDGDMTYEERAVVDAREAMDAMCERFGVSTFILVGLCAGAMNAHRAAVADARVVGAVMLDGYAYRTQSYFRRRLPAKVLDPDAWRRGRDVAKHQVSSILSRARTALRGPISVTPHTSTIPDAPPSEGERESTTMPGQGAVDIFAQDWPPLATVRTELDGLLARGARMLFLYTGGWSDYVFEGQFDEMFPNLARRDHIDVVFYPEADHTYLMRAHRERMFTRVEQFLERFERR